MIAIIDSGSTKADWIFTDGQKTLAFNTIGMNPNFINEQEVSRIIKDSIIKSVSAKEIQKVFYFGTGCSGIEQKKIISNALLKLFINAKILVEHDIMGAVIATCGKEEGIACIIGTGSNSVYFDGMEIQKNNYGLGYILGDEGAGVYLGKKLITHYLYGLLPKNLSDDFREKYRLTRNDVIINVYNNPTANAWIGSFAQFFTEHKEDLWVRNTVKKGLEEFVQLFVKNYPRYREIPVHFVGSIAFHYSEVLKKVAYEHKFNLGKIIHKPIEGLTEYFIKLNF